MRRLRFVLATILSCAMMMGMMPGSLTRADSPSVEITFDTEFIRGVFCGADSSYSESEGTWHSSYSTATADANIHVTYNSNTIASNVFSYTIPPTSQNPAHRGIDVYYKVDDLSLYNAFDSVNIVVNGVKFEYGWSNEYVNNYSSDIFKGLSVSFSKSADVGIMLLFDASFLQTVDMYRLYNPNSGEHFYTANVAERDMLISVGWDYEGIGWIAPNMSNVPVYRLYNQYGGEHHYTTNVAERDALVAGGWNYEGIGWYSSEGIGWYTSTGTPLVTYTDDDYAASVLMMAGWVPTGDGWYSGDVPKTALYRQYNPNAFANNHNYTTSLGENDYLVSIGWQAEGIGWYGLGS